MPTRIVITMITSSHALKALSDIFAPVFMTRGTWILVTLSKLKTIANADKMTVHFWRPEMKSETAFGIAKKYSAKTITSMRLAIASGIWFLSV